MSMSTSTRKYKHLSRLMAFLSALVLLGPMFYYVATGFVIASPAGQYALGAFSIIAILLTVVNLIFKFRLRSPIWLVVLGIYLAIETILPLILCLAIGTVLDEFVFSPLHKRFKAKYTINAEIDKRTH